MTAPRFYASGGTLLENVAGRMVQRDPDAVRAQAERWSRDAVAADMRDNHALARIIARDALAATLALSVLDAWRRAAR